MTALRKRICGLLGFRSSRRLPLMWKATVEWQDRFGEGVSSGVCRNFSKGGLSLYLAEPIRHKSTVTVRVGNGDTCIATVRHCRQEGDGYLVGLEFARARRRRAA